MEAKASAQVLLNCNYAVELGKKINLVLVGIDGNDIKSGNKKLIQALCKKNVLCIKLDVVMIVTILLPCTCIH
jgi:hypothetical protein